MTARFSHFLQTGLLSLTAADLLLFTPLAVLTVAFASRAVVWLRMKKSEPVPYTRKVFHFIVFSAAGIFQLRFGLKMTVLFGIVTCAAVLAAVWKGRGTPLFEALARPKDSPHEGLFILVPLASTALGGVLSNVWFPQTAFIGYLVTGWADAVAEPVGTAWGRHRYRVPSLFGVKAVRSLEGSLSVLVTAFVAVLLCGWTFGLGWGAALRMALACGVTAALVEASSHHGLDNLFVQVAVAGVAAWFVR
jgi:phytol kinase